MKPFFIFYLKNYLRSHRYIRELLLAVIFNIFFYGFLYGSEPEDAIWTVFGVLSLLLNMVTVPSLFYLEKGNSLIFGIVRESGRIKFLFSKILLAIFIDMLWVIIFTLIYGIRFGESIYFIYLGPRLILLTFLMALSISILSLSYTYKPQFSWIILLLFIFGGILNKSALFPLDSIKEAYVILSVILPPFLEIIYGAVTLKFTFWQIIFLFIAVIQIGVYLFINKKLILQKDFV